jgi:hypothetical protein
MHHETNNHPNLPLRGTAAAVRIDHTFRLKKSTSNVGRKSLRPALPGGLQIYEFIGRNLAHISAEPEPAAYAGSFAAPGSNIRRCA